MRIHADVVGERTHLRLHGYVAHHADVVGERTHLRLHGYVAHHAG
jgi:hypothetical protein